MLFVSGIASDSIARAMSRQRCTDDRIDAVSNAAGHRGLPHPATLGGTSSRWPTMRSPAGATAAFGAIGESGTGLALGTAVFSQGSCRRSRQVRSWRVLARRDVT